MDLSNFDESTLAGGNSSYANAVRSLHDRFGFDFTSLGLAAFFGSPLHWIYSTGSTDDRHKRIALAPGHGIGGIVLKSGRPMLFTDIDHELDPREYSSYPIVFAEDLHSFIALPVTKKERVVGVLLAGFRCTDASHAEVFEALRACAASAFDDLGVITCQAMDFDEISSTLAPVTQGLITKDTASKLIAAQEEERRRISRELHDGIAQELLGVRFQLQKISAVSDDPAQVAAHSAQAALMLDAVLDELHNISVELRPSTLDHFGLVSALKSQAAVYRESLGALVEFDVPAKIGRMDPAYETQVYRIAQEAMSNACKYASKKPIRISIKTADDWVEVQVADKGEGFDVEHPVIRGSGCGLPGMRERASLIGATLTVTSTPNGSSVSLLAPMGNFAKEGQ